MLEVRPEQHVTLPPPEVEARVVELAKGLAVEVHPALRQTLRVNLSSTLDRDLGLDSLGRVELLSRVERDFEIELPADTLVRATTTGQLARAVLDAHPTHFRAHARAPPREPEAELPDQARTLVEVFEWHAARHPDHAHVLVEDARRETITHGALHAAARRVAAGLAARDVRPGETVAIMLPTCRAFFEAFAGALYAGAIPVPLYPPASVARIEEHVARQAGILVNAESRVLVTNEDARLVAALIRARVPVLRHVESVERLARDDGAGRFPLAAQPADLALLQYTSGSTGDPKGVMLSHANLLANIRAMGRAAQVTPRDVFVSWLPLYHDMGLIGAWLASLCHSVQAVIMPPFRFLARPEAWLWALHEHRATITASPNFAWELCLKKIDDAQLVGLDLSSVRVFCNGAEPVNASTIERFAARFARYGLRREALSPMYGLAESSLGVAIPPPGRGPIVDHVDRRALLERGEAVPVAPEARDALDVVACGLPLKDHAVRVIDALGRELAERREGRLQFQGPSATRGYWRNPEKTRKLFDGAWLDTGDTAYIAKGDVFPTGRVKDIIIRAGQHVHPHELEAVVGDVPGVRRGCVAVFGVPDESTRTERVVIVAEARDAGLRTELTRRIIDAVTPAMGEPPDEVVVAPPHAVPKTPSGKIRRTACRDLYVAGRLEARVRPPRFLWLTLALAAVRSWLRAAWYAVRAIAWAAWFWFVFVLALLLGWPAVMVAPGGQRKRAVLHAVARAIVVLLGVRVRVHGAEHLADARVVAINHSSYIDGLIAAAVLPPRFRFVAKSELRSQLIAGPFTRGIEAIFVEREDFVGQQGLETAAQRTEEIAQALRDGASLIVFPEGTLRRAPGLTPFHLGAFVAAASAGVAMAPVTFVGMRTLLRGDQWFPRRGDVDVYVAAPVAPPGSGFEAALEVRARVREAMLKPLGEPDLAA